MRSNGQVAAATGRHDGIFRVCRAAAAVPTRICTGVRHFGVPDFAGRSGGMLIASNHQSFIDPILIGIGTKEPVSFLARDTLFVVPGFGWLIRKMGTHPVRRGTADSTALKTVIRLLRGGEVLLMFPEGTRTRDGAVGEFRPGAAAIAIRCGVPIVPVCIEGAFDCWPRDRMLPRPSRVGVAFGEPMETRGKDARELIGRVRAEVERLQVFLRGHLNAVGAR